MNAISTSDRAPVVELRNLVKEYRQGPLSRQVLRALDGVTLTVRRGEVFGFLGPNGAGKTTALKIILGFLHPTAGDVRLLGTTGALPAARRQIGYLPETATYPEYCTPEELVSFYGRLSGLGGNRLRTRTSAVLELVGLAADARRPLRQFSKGMQQRVGLAQALVHEPECLILDEPASGLDPLGRRDMREFINRLRQQGLTIFFSSHELSEVEAICDTVAILHRGRVCAVGALETLLAPYQGYRTRAEALEAFFVNTIHDHEHPDNH